MRSEATNIVGVERDGEHFVFVFDDQHTEAAIRQLGAWADDDSLPFTWHDATILAEQVRVIAAKVAYERSCEMEEFDELSRKLAKVGFWPTVALTHEGWRCTLANNTLHRPPEGKGQTALEALRNANAERVQLLEARA